MLLQLGELQIIQLTTPVTLKKSLFFTFGFSQVHRSAYQLFIYTTKIKGTFLVLGKRLVITLFNIV